MGARLIKILQNICEISQSAVRVDGELGDWFRTTVGTRQGDPISPTTFIAYLERIMDPIRDNGTGSIISNLQMTLIYWRRIEINYKGIWNGSMKQERPQDYRSTRRRQ